MGVSIEDVYHRIVVLLKDLFHLGFHLSESAKSHENWLLTNKLNKHLHLNIPTEMKYELLALETLCQTDGTDVSHAFWALQKFETGLVRTEVAAAGRAADRSIVLLVLHHHWRMGHTA